MSNPNTQYLEDNASKEGVHTTDSGLQYRILEEGSGPKPGPRDKVTVHYEGKLVNGKEFDSSYKRGQPIDFPLNAVIPGWSEGVQLMNEGATYEFVIPANLGYGAQGAGGSIPGHSTLIFKVELIKVG